MSSFSDFLLPPAKSTLASHTDALFNFVNISGFILLAAITAALIYFAIKYRRKSENDVTPVISHHNKLEITWSVVPLILVMVIFGWGFRAFMDLQTPPEDAMEIHVTGQQWLWQFTYANGAKTTRELHVPAGKPVKLIMSSRDVIHSFYVPDYRIKKDVLPNRYTSVWFNAKKPGESVIFCTEYCGTGHSDMMGKVIVHKPDEYQDWLASSKAPAGSDLSPVEQGKQLVQANACLTCHSTDGSRKIGPSFKGIFGHEVEFADGSKLTVDENYIRESILNPKAKVVKGFSPVMPTFKGSLEDSQIDAIVQYIKSLK